MLSRLALCQEPKEFLSIQGYHSKGQRGRGGKRAAAKLGGILVAGGGGWSDVHQRSGDKFPTDEHTKRRDEKVREPTPGRAVVFSENTNIRTSTGIFPVKILILRIRVINSINSYKYF